VAYRLAVCLVLVTFLSGCAIHRGAPQEPVEVPRTEAGEVRVERYTPAAWPEKLQARVRRPAGEGRNPAVLVVHGGGWEGGSPEDMAGMAKYLARRGFVTVNVAYRFTPEYRFPAQLRDVQQAMRWIHANADRLGIDPDRIGAVGYSSGAHLVSLLALVAGQGGELDGGSKTRPDAVVAGGTPSDLRKWADGRLVENFLGGTRAEVPDAYAAASPVTHVHPNAPPVFLYHGRWDTLVPPDHATDFRQTLTQAGVETELYLQRLRGHVLTFLFWGGAMEEAARFLHEHLGAQSTAASVGRRAGGGRGPRQASRIDSGIAPR